MSPEETKIQDDLEQTAEPMIEATPVESTVEPAADSEPVSTNEPKTVEQPQRLADAVEEKTVEQITPEPAPPTQTPVPKQPVQAPEPQPQQPQIQTVENKISPQGRTSPVATAPPRGTTFPRDFVFNLLNKARAKIQERKRKKLDKVMTLFKKKPQITNKDIQKLLRISSATAVRYLDILEAEDCIKQVGNTGKSVFYTKVR